jgi:hypothetical protein
MARANMMLGSSLLLGALLLIALAGCDDATEVLVHLEASSDLEARSASLAVIVTRADGTRFSQVNAVGTEVDLPATVPVIPAGGDASHRFRIDAALIDASGSVISRVSADEGFEEGALREVTLRFPDQITCESRPGRAISVPDLVIEDPTALDIPGSELVIEIDAGETWIVIATGEWTSYPGAATNPCGLALVVDGEERAYGEPLGGYGQSWHGMAFVRGEAAAHTVSLRAMSSNVGSSTLRDMRIVAFPLPGFADFQAIETLGEVVVPTSFTPVAALEFEPILPGRYVFLFNAAAGERPGGNGVLLDVITPEFSQWPAAASLRFGREALLPYFLSRTADLALGPASFTIRARSTSMTGEGATVRDARLVAFRADAFCDFAEQFSNTPVAAPGDELVESQAPLARDASPMGTSWLTIQDQLLGIGHMDVDARVVFRRDGEIVRDINQQTVSVDELHPVGFVDLVESDDGIEVSAEVARGAFGGTDVYDTRVVESHALILRF